jgi:hypothetical protein
MEQTMQRGSRSGWQEAESNQLLTAVQAAAEQGRPLKMVFEQVAENLGRKPNSIRNYYYQLVREMPQHHLQRAAPFEMFTADEVHTLLREVLLGKAKGLSVRACVLHKSGGDRSLMLRYQNKYRAILKNKPHMLDEIAQELRSEGYTLPEMAIKRPAQAAETAEIPMQKMAQALSDPSITMMMEGLNTLLYRATQNNNMSKLVELDRLQVAFDMNRLRWEDEEKRLFEALGDMMAICRDFLAQPMKKREEELPKFSADIAMAISNGESLLTEYGQ